MKLSYVLVALGGFVAMEAVSYATHRWVMHGFGMRWHRSHHRPSTGGLEKNDLFPVFFSSIGFGVFLTASLTSTTWLYWLGGGITAYGAVYLAVHEVYIHRRLACPIDDRDGLDWLRDSHEIHHLFGGEPYGMLLPVVKSDLRRRAAERVAEQTPPDQSEAEASVERLSRRAISRNSRARL
jgi:beta-carotene 3-hydroxylase